MIDEMFRRFGIEIDTMEFEDFVDKYAMQNIPPGGLITAWVGGEDGTEEIVAACEQNRESD